jgi:hypothetical protein
MIVSDPELFRAQIRSGWLIGDSPPVPRAVFLVEPSGFRLSEQTARDNQYMDLDVQVDPNRALDQHRRLAEALTACGVPVVRFPGHPSTPDDLFPNNVFATIRDRLIVGAMCHPERRLEAKRADIRSFFESLMECEVIDLSGRDLVAELTGSLVIDRARRLGFCGLSQRANKAGCEAMHEAFDLAMTFQFELSPHEYHTNVVMSVLASRAVLICPDGFVDARVPEAICEAFRDHCLILSEAEKLAFAANCIAVNFEDLFMSELAAETLSSAHHAKLQSWGFKVHSVALDEIEKAGGSLRCCVAEIF